MASHRNSFFPVAQFGNTPFPWLIALLAACAAAMLLPCPSGFNYRYTEGKTWLYDDLVAPFDFPVMVVAPEGVPPAVVPYYWLDPSVARTQKGQLSDLIRQQIKISSQDAQYEDLIANSGAYSALAMTLLENTFRRGIVLKKADQPGALVLNGQSGTTTPYPAVLTLEQALENITDSLPFAQVRQPELLLPFIEKVLVPNVFFSDSLTSIYGKGALPSGKGVKKGAVIVHKGDKIDVTVRQQLDSLKVQYAQDNQWRVRLGYFLFCLIGIFSMFGWLYLYRAHLLKSAPVIAGIILGVLLLILICHFLGNAVPLLLPLYLMPLILRTRYGLKSAIVIWSVPVLLAGFALDWGTLWIHIQVAGVGTGLLLNEGVNRWRDRIQALIIIFSVQSLVWLATVLAEKAPVTMRTSDTIVFLAIAALLSISQSVLVRFFNFTLR